MIRSNNGIHSRSRVAFIQTGVFEKISIHYLAGALKANGIEYDIFIEELEDDFFDAVKNYNPDFVVYSLFIGEENSAFRCLGRLKKLLPNAKTLVGGPFTLIFPEICKRDEVDFLFRGDGEYSLPEFIRRFKACENLSEVKGICYIDDSKHPVINKDLDLVDLQNIPEPDRALYYKYEVLADNPSKMVISSRGCPYHCTYCYNVELSKCFKTKFWRTRNIEDVIAEVKYLCSNYRTQWIVFPDGTFNASKKWLEAFLTTYAKNNLPKFLCNARVENMDSKMAALLKDAGCDRITIGIQAGNEAFRRRITGRHMSNRQIIEACNVCKSHGIRVGVDIIFGWPGETLEQAMDTINLCRRIDADSYSSNVLIFYPGLEITEYAFKNGHIEKYPTLETIEELTPNQSLLVSPLTNQLINLDKFFYFFIRFPRLEKGLLLLAKLPPNNVFLLLKNIHLLARSFKYDKHRTKWDLIRNYVKSSLKAAENHGKNKKSIISESA